MSLRAVMSCLGERQDVSYREREAPAKLATQQELRSPIGRIVRVSFYLPLALRKQKPLTPSVVAWLFVCTDIRCQTIAFDRNEDRWRAVDLVESHFSFV